MKPHLVCHMITSLDGRLHPSGWSRSPDGTRAEWSGIYERLHEALDGDGWIVGRVTMAEMAKGTPHPPAETGTVDRRRHLPVPGAASYAIALDRGGKLHFAGSTLGGDPVVVVLGGDVPDSHLAELAADGIGYLVSDGAELDLAALLTEIGRQLGIRRLLLEGGANANGAFFAAGLVDEVSLLLCPALDGRTGVSTIVEAGDTGLADKVELSLISCEPAGHGTLHLRYAVRPL
ncbi:dihydrofolate reductase family protein [Ancylobacter sp. Lp-2]|uniref:dihydrofolate reductase family protein n=1 Tax=Ancylobacter sp. Lp-2 TaxID=2881339 RepID=UPI001E320E7F|nr:dihydrofolate reductase family protein [Ancylobacter sp. Lp-2]MCB4769093.1 dihydrofolate reductase family protein [Ancylobacter sp. Lp-2]